MLEIASMAFIISQLSRKTIAGIGSIMSSSHSYRVPNIPNGSPWVVVCMYLNKIIKKKQSTNYATSQHGLFVFVNMLEPLKDLAAGRNCYQNNLRANQTIWSVLCSIFERASGLILKLSLAWTSIIKHNHAAGQFPLQHLPDYKPIGRAVSNESRQQGPPQCHQIASCQNQVFPHSQWEHKVF